MSLSQPMEGLSCGITACLCMNQRLVQRRSRRCDSKWDEKAATTRTALKHIYLVWSRPWYPKDLCGKLASAKQRAWKHLNLFENMTSHRWWKEKNKFNKDLTSSRHKSHFDCDKPVVRKKKRGWRSALPAYLISHRGGINEDSSSTARARVWCNSLMSRPIILPSSEVRHLVPCVNRA